MSKTLDSPQLAECARRLESLAMRTSAFFDSQLERLRDLGTSCESFSTGPNDASPTGTADAVWQQEKEDGRLRIKEQLDHLAQAWQQLEAEQRKLMMSGQPLSAEATTTPEPEPTVVPVVTQVHSLDLIEESAPLGAASAAMQFQKLKREIRQRSRRQR